MKHLEGKNLIVLNIHRKGIFDMDAMIFCCDNCGRAIVNSATVQDTETGKTYVIGLDCKKTLIDKRLFDHITSTMPEWEAKYKIKELKRDLSDLQKVMACLDNPEKYKVTADRAGKSQWLYIMDKTQQGMFGTMGKTIFSESIAYLFKIGLKDVLTAAMHKGLIQPQ